MNCFKVQAINRHKLLTDGEGVTTLVGLMGCPLKCSYCLNKDILSKNRFRQYSPEELAEEVLKDYCYFLATGGGVTFGGGEPLLYEEQILEFIRLLPQGVRVNLETSLNYHTQQFDELCKLVSFFIIDIKTLDETVYQKYTGRDMNRVKEHLEFLRIRGYADKCKIRIPVIPGFVTEEEAEDEKILLQDKGFIHTEVFCYVIR